MNEDSTLDGDNFCNKVHGDLHCPNRDIHNPNQERELGNDSGRTGRIVGVVGTCSTCGGTVLPSVWPLVYCGKCNRYQNGCNKVAEVPVEKDTEKETNLQKEISREYSMIYISFVEEAVMNPKYEGYIGGRIEVYDDKDSGYSSEEIRFFTKDIDGFNTFRDEWDMKDVTPEELDFIKDVVKERWCDNV